MISGAIVALVVIAVFLFSFVGGFVLASTAFASAIQKKGYKNFDDIPRKDGAA